MGEVFLTPTDEGSVVELSRTMFRKKILPMGTIDYKGRKINFDRQYLTDLATSFGEAYDQVPFMLADSQNAHTMDPERYRGECKGVEVGEDGLYGTFELTADAADLVKRNPALGVSARIVEGYSRSDGKHFPRAMQHVLGTLDPRIPGLGAWQEVSLSGYDQSAEVVDLTSSAYEIEETAMADKHEQGSDDLTQEEYDALMAYLEDLDGEETVVESEGAEDEGDEDEQDEDEPAASEREPAVAALSNEDDSAQSVLELANEQIRQLKAARAEDRFEADKREYVRKGVPPALVELARPILTAPDGLTLDLSNGVEDKQVDAVNIVRQLLDSAVGYIDLARERGHSADFSDEGTSRNDEEDELLSLWAQMDEQH